MPEIRDRTLCFPRKQQQHAEIIYDLHRGERGEVLQVVHQDIRMVSVLSPENLKSIHPIRDKIPQKCILLEQLVRRPMEERRGGREGRREGRTEWINRSAP